MDSVLACGFGLVAVSAWVSGDRQSVVGATREALYMCIRYMKPRACASARSYQHEQRARYRLQLIVLQPALYFSPLSTISGSRWS